MRRYSCGGGRMTTRMWSCLAVLLVAIVSDVGAQQQAPQPPPAAPPAAPRAAPSSGPRASTVTVTVTDEDGAPARHAHRNVPAPIRAPGVHHARTRGDHACGRPAGD